MLDTGKSEPNRGVDSRTFTEGECFGFMEAIGFFASRGVNTEILLEASRYCVKNILEERGNFHGESFNADGSACGSSRRAGT